MEFCVLRIFEIQLEMVESLTNNAYIYANTNFDSFQISDQTLIFSNDIVFIKFM